MHLFLDKMVLNLRQIDYTSLMRCSDLNFLYTDSNYKDYNYAQNNKNEIIEERIIEVDDYLSMLFSLKINEIELKLFKNDSEIITSLTLFNKNMIFKRTLSNKSDISLNVTKMKVYQYINNQKANDFITEIMHENNSNENDENSNKYEIEMKFLIEKDREKSIIVNINNIKFFVRIDILNLIRFFFLNGFPNYSDSNQEDLPNACKIFYIIQMILTQIITQE